MIAHVISSPQDSRKLYRASAFVANFDRKFLIPVALWIQKLEICFKADKGENQFLSSFWNIDDAMGIAERSFDELINTAV